MATKLVQITQNQLIAAAGTNIDPLLRDVVAGSEIAVGPDAVIAVPKATAANPFVSSALQATGNITIGHGGVGNILHDILFLRIHSVQRALAAGNEKYADLQLATSVPAGAGLTFDPALSRGGVAQTPSIVVPIPKAAAAAATGAGFIAAALAPGNVIVQHAEVGAVDFDITSLLLHSIFDLQNAVFNTYINQVDRVFTIADVGPDASVGAIYEDDDDTTRQFEVRTAKVSGDGATVLICRQIAGTSVPTTGGADNLSLVSGTGDADIPYTGITFNKLVDLQQDVAVPNGAGLVFNPGLQLGTTRVMPDIVIPVPKATATVGYVPTDLTGAVGNVTVQHNGGAPVNFDILSIRLHSIQRDL